MNRNSFQGRTFHTFSPVSRAALAAMARPGGTTRPKATLGCPSPKRKVGHAAKLVCPTCDCGAHQQLVDPLDGMLGSAAFTLAMSARATSSPAGVGRTGRALSRPRESPPVGPSRPCLGPSRLLENAESGQQSPDSELKSPHSGTVTVRLGVFQARVGVFEDRVGR